MLRLDGFAVSLYAFLVLLMSAVFIPLPHSPVAAADRRQTEDGGLSRNFNEQLRQALQLYKEGKYAEAVPPAENALKLLEQDRRPDDVDLAIPLWLLGDMYRLMGNYKKAEPLLRRSLALREKARGVDHPDILPDLRSLGLLYKATGSYVKAEELLRRTLSLRERALGTEHVNIASALVELGEVYDASKQYSKSESLYQRALAIREKTFGSEHIVVAQTLSHLADVYLMTKRYEKAEQQYQRALMIYDKTLGPDSAPTNLHNLAMVYLQTGQLNKAEPLFLRALAIRDKQGLETLDLALTLIGLGDVYSETRQYEKAEAAFHRSLTVQRKVLGPENLTTADTLDKLAKLYQSMGRHAEAERLYQRGMTIREKQLGFTHPEVAKSLQRYAVFLRQMNHDDQATQLESRAANILKAQEELREANVLSSRAANLYQAKQFEEARPLAQRALEIRENILGPYDPSVAQSLNALAELYEALRDYQKAEPLYQRTVTIWEKVRGLAHPDVAKALNNLAMLYGQTGAYKQALPLMERTIRIVESTYEPQEDAFLARSLNNLGWLYHSKGDDSTALPFYERALAIQEKALSPNHPDLATSAEDLGDVYLSIRDLEKAESLYKRALIIIDRPSQSERGRVANILYKLATTRKAMGKYGDVESLYQRALTIRETLDGNDNAAVADTLEQLADFYAIFWIADLKSAPSKINPKEDKIKRFAKAEPLYKRALAIREKLFGPDHLTVANSLSLLAYGYLESGREADAAALWKRALSIYEKQSDGSSRGVLVSLAKTATRQHDYRSAIGFYKRLFALEDQQIQNAFTFTTEQQKLTFIESMAGNYLKFLSLVVEQFPNDPEMTRYAFEVVVRRKGIVFDAQSRMREASRERSSETLRQDWDRMAALQQEVSRLSLNKPAMLSAEQYKDKLASLTHQIEQIELQLAQVSSQVAQDIEQRDATIDNITKQLPKNGALVEFVNMTRGIQFINASQYLGFVLRSTGQISVFEIGCHGVTLENLLEGEHALKCDKTIPLWFDIHSTIRSLKEAPESSHTKAFEALYGDVWAPLESALVGIEKVYISPDGDLNLIPFAALVDKTGRSLVERYRIAHVSSGRQLAGIKQNQSKPPTDLLLVANPAFDHSMDKGYSSIAVRSRSFNAKFDPLPGTEREAKEIPPLIANKRGQEVLVGDQATEAAVKSAYSPRILHLATHGFFLGDKEIASGQTTRGVSVSSQEGSISGSQYENPLLRSGLAFAGANRAAEVVEGDDGILTALEITGMDLASTDLVVLSACDTGLGKERNGEGVFGLRRAFALAGAKNLLMSLWPISDEITADQMIAFYENLQTLPPAEALRQAQLETIKGLKAKYNGVAPVALWAPFILQGAQALGS